MQPISLDQLPPEVLALIEATKSGTATGQRSPVRAPLADLRTPQNPKQRLNRPSFFFEMGETPEPYSFKPYPALRYKLIDGKVEERRVDHASTDQELLGAGWLTSPPYQAPETMTERQAREAVESQARQTAELAAITAELDALSPEDREWIIKAQSDARKQALMERLSSLSETDLTAVAGEPKKRGPGRPKKVDDGA